jgi:acetyl-CoA C-acetyltransferase
MSYQPDDNTPIIIGAGQHVERLDQPSPPLNPPMQLAAEAGRQALEDARVPATMVDAIGVIRLFSDSPGIWQSPFGGSNNPPESVARRIGANPQHRLYSNTGGTEPLQLMFEMMQAIARGEIKVALLTGAEAIASQRFAMRRNIEADWREEFDEPLDDRQSSQRFVSPEELGAGFNLPVRYYAAIENHQAHRMGHDVKRHAMYMGELMAPFAEVAAANPYSQSPQRFSAREIIEEGPDNYPISLPYSKRLVAQDAVNQAAAILLTSVGQARELGVAPDQWVFLESGALGSDHFLSQRVDPGRSEAMARVLTTTLEKAGVTPGELDLIDLYSCFPCAVTAACAVLDLPTDGSRPLTVTGGLPYFGGPGNNYSLHALAEMAVRLRGAPSRALVSANGGMLSKHAAALLTPDPARAGNIDWQRVDGFALDCTDIARKSYATSPEGGDIVTYTVVTRRDKPDLGLVMAETPAGERFLTSSTEPAVTDAMRAQNPIGRSVDVRLQGERRVFSLSGS